MMEKTDNKNTVTFGLSPTRLAWRRFRRNRSALIGGVILIIMYLCVLFGSFLSPYDPTARDYKNVNLPPTAIHFFDENGKFHARPFVYGMTLTDPMRFTYKVDTTKKFPLRFFAKGWKYKLWWVIPCERHLFTVDAPGRIALLGTDSVGKDVFSRVLEGGKISMSIGLLGISISLILGMFIGSIAGYFGGWWDLILMRLVEFLLAIPGLYLIIALRAYFQTESFLGLGGKDMTSGQMYLIIVLILAFIGWAGQARVIRGMVMAISKQDFIQAERALGASTLRIITRHILPNTMSYVIVAATIAVPGYILGEVSLSYLGVGIQDPQVSWGIMLEQAQNASTIRNCPWLLFSPAVVIFLTVFSFNFLGDGLRDALDPRYVSKK